MVIEINGKDYPLEFGLGFVRRLNDLHGIVQNGVNFKGAVSVTIGSLVDGDMELLADYILCANKDLSAKKVDAFIEETALKDETGEAIEKLVADILKAIEKGSATRIPFKKAMKKIQAAMA